MHFSRYLYDIYYHYMKIFKRTGTVCNREGMVEKHA